MDPVGIVIEASIFALGAGAALLRLRESRTRAVRVGDAWRQAARLTDGEWVEERVWYALKTGTVCATIDDVVVTVDSAANSRARVGQAGSTNVRAEVSGAGSLGLAITDNGVAQTARSIIRALPVRLRSSDLSIEGAHEVTTTHAGLARAWMSPAVQRAVVASRPYSFQLARGKALVWREGLEEDADRLARVMRAAAVFAGRGKKITRAWSAMAGRLGAELTSPLTMEGGPASSIRLTRRASEVSVTFEVRGERAFTAVRAGWQAADGEFVLEPIRASMSPPRLPRIPAGDESFDRRIALYAREDSHLPQRLGPELKQALIALGFARVVADAAELRIDLDGFTTTSVDAAIDIAVAIASINLGPYR